MMFREEFRDFVDENPSGILVWYKALGPIGSGFDSHKGVFPCLLGFLLNWCDITSSGDGYDRVVPVVAR
ncbi:hypothetical protein HanXRQr2_Chr05g0236601 [Helianthus annuus]|uniref:Uncharacterized protein n=1 Tax=Helianthus annuus TaxID=4232 RepID=A0A9K3J2Q7_HELAN|nr:hypothetical protein HanXRQr2_Chr05g0236601 [Helianthus annuus]